MHPAPSVPTFTSVWEGIASRHPDLPALYQGEDVLTWAELNTRAARFAAYLTQFDAPASGHVGIALKNRPEYVAAWFGSLKAGLTPFNINYRYTEQETRELVSDADPIVVVGEKELSGFTNLSIEFPQVRGWLSVDAAAEETWTQSYRESVDGLDPEPFLSTNNSEGNIILYTGGTTGRPKGVVWRQSDLYSRLMPQSRSNTEADLDHVDSLISSATRENVLPALPLMHGAGLFVLSIGLCRGASATLLESASFDGDEFLRTVARRNTTTIGIAGDWFVEEIAKSFNSLENPQPFEGVRVVASAGAMLTPERRDELLTMFPNAVIADTFGSTEAVGMGKNLYSSKRRLSQGSFKPDRSVHVLREDGSDVTPGSGEVGQLAMTGAMPLYYLNDPEKTRKTFQEINGVRYSVPGDFATIDADGSIRFLGRGSQCVNTAGEKVFVEEVESTLKMHDAVEDAIVFGVPDPKFGQRVQAMVRLAPNSGATEDELRQALRTHLAGYKIPQRVLAVEHIPRNSLGKPAYAEAVDLFETLCKDAPENRDRPCPRTAQTTGEPDGLY